MATNKPSDNTDLTAKTDEAVAKFQDKIHDVSDQAA